MASIREKIRIMSQEHAVSVGDVLTVVACRRLSPGFQRVTLTGDCLSGYSPACPADGFKIDLAPDGSAQQLLRGYTVRNLDPSARRFDFDIALHRGGLATEWAVGVRPGDRVRFVGFRREFAVGDGITRHFLVADASALPAAAAIVEALPRGHEVTLIAEVGHEDDRSLMNDAIAASRAGAGAHLDCRWIIGQPSVGQDSPLARAAMTDPIGPDVEAWLAAESSTVRAIRRHLLNVAEVPRHRLQASAYWVQGLTNTARDTREMVRFQEALDAGIDIQDPSFYERMQFDEPIEAS